MTFWLFGGPGTLPIKTVRRWQDRHRGTSNVGSIIGRSGMAILYCVCQLHAQLIESEALARGVKKWRHPLYRQSKLIRLQSNGPGACCTKAANPVGGFLPVGVRGIPGAQSRFLRRLIVPSAKKKPREQKTRGSRPRGFSLKRSLSSCGGSRRCPPTSPA